MFRMGLLLIIVGCIVAAVTNPNLDDHKKVVYQNLPNQAGAEGLVAEIAGRVLGNVDPLPLSYHSYFLFSTTKFRDETMSVGLLTRVWPAKTASGPEGN
ncbi:MAG: hypothetical protein U1E05_18850 [Patescibacteria group bacterium]|nr:hypothetical protein [Patescibacteria group bacterium]